MSWRQSPRRNLAPPPIAHTLHPTPYTRHLTPYALIPTPYTPHTTPYTLLPTSYIVHPTPHTLHRAHYSLHPTPHTLRPTPYTLHTTPYTLHPTPGRRNGDLKMGEKCGRGREGEGVGLRVQVPWRQCPRRSPAPPRTPPPSLLFFITLEPRVA